MVGIFSITVSAEEPLTSNPSSDTSSLESSSSESSSSSSEEASSSENTTSSEPEPEIVKTTLQIIDLPIKTVYELGESLNLNGLKVNITTNSGVIVSNNGADLIVSATVLNTEGEQKIQLQYQDATAFFTVKVNPKHTHQFGAWEIKKEATCVQNGEKIRKCECEMVETVAIAKLGHDWDEGEIVKKATTEQAGQIKYICTRCQTENVEIIPKLTGVVDDNKSISTEKFKLTLQWWMVFVPVGLIIIGYIAAIAIIFKKKA